MEVEAVLNCGEEVVKNLKQTAKYPGRLVPGPPAGRDFTCKIRDCSMVTGANPRIARREQEELTSDPLKDDELAPNSANGSIPSLIA